MCGRYAIAPESPEAWASVAAVLGEPVAQALQERAARHNLAPTAQVPMIYQTGLARIQLVDARWGLVPHWWKGAEPPAYPTFNARSEDAATKPTWRDAWRLTRCLIPASHWYEWQKQESGKQPHALSTADGRAFMFAGLYALWSPPGREPLRSCAILTRAAVESVAAIHERMPVILHPDGWLPWLDPRPREADEVSALLREHAVLDVQAWKVSTRVNTPRHDDAALLHPV